MFSVVVEQVVPGPPERAYALGADMASYPKYMDAVKSLQILERHGNTQKSAWAALFQGKLLRWIEEDIFDDEAHTIVYRQLEGDLKKFEGAWRFTPVAEGTRITLTVDVDLGVPMLAGLLDPVARLITKRNSESMLQSIAARLTAATGTE